MYNLYMGCVCNVLRISKFIFMSYEIEIESQDDECVVFYINDVAYKVDIETQIVTQEYPVSFNQFNDKIVYAEEDVIYYYVMQNTLECSGINYYDDIDICNELEEILNNG
jgi:hypothetical protein